MAEPANMTSDDDAQREAQRAEIAARLQQVREMKARGDLPQRDAKTKRNIEGKQRKSRVNSNLLRGQGEGRDETWTIRAKAAHIKAVKSLAEQLSEPRAKVSVASLMDEAIEMLLEKYRGGGSDA